MTEKYEQAIKETFEYLDECLVEQPREGTIENLLSLGVDKRYVIERQMDIRGFTVYCESNYDMSEIIVYPEDFNLPIHIWRKKGYVSIY